MARMFNKKIYMKIYHQEHKEEEKAYSRKYYIEHKEDRKIYRQEHKKEAKTYRKKWHEEHSEEEKARSKKYREEYRKKIFLLLGNKCANHQKNYGCDCADIRVLQIDHINGGGKKELKLFVGHLKKYYENILQHPENYQILCANCNWIKKVENNEMGVIKIG